ncbi:MAG: hypothetical protein MZV70_24155 [Desulfobacterales bacterium]|nr:hypothetical protein [Desulfobacterales bacterium]
MTKDTKIRWGWIKGMYIYTIVVAGLFGLGIIVVPEMIKSKFTWPVEEPVAFGIIGSVYMAFGLLSILGLRSPLKFTPILLLQLCYKTIWFIGVVLPLWATGPFPKLRHTYRDNLCNLYRWRPDCDTFFLCLC